MTLAPDPLLERIRQDPDAPAVAARAATWTRAQLLDAADELALALHAERLGEGRRIACLLDDDAPAVALIHAARRQGAVHIPLNRRASVPELRDQLVVSAADGLLCDKANEGKARKAAPEGMATHRIEALLAGVPCALPPTLRDRIDLDAPATVVFTSGTTGRPKGAVLTHDNHRASAHAWAALLRPQPADRWLLCVPLFHVAGLAIVTRATRWGAALDVLDRFDPTIVSARLEDGVTHLSLVAAQLLALLDEREDRPVPSSLRGILLGGGPVPSDLLTRARAAGYPVLTTYGLTETGSGVASGGGDQATLDDPTAGQALPGVELRIADDGEILVRGEMVFSGYLGDDAATARALPGDGWLHTGDFGSLDADGLLRVSARRHDLIISGGENITPAEIEAVLESHPGIGEAVVIGVPHERWGAVPRAYVVPTGSTGPTDDALKAYCRDRLATYKVPADFVRVRELPRNAMGKVARAELGDVTGTGRSMPSVHRDRQGDGPPLLLLHSTLSSSRQLRSLATRLAEHHTVVSIDRLGSGRSTFDGPAVPIPVTKHIEDLAQVLAAERLGPVAVVGHSFGGCIAIELASQRPELVSAVFAYEPPYASVASPEVQAGMAEVGRRTLAARDQNGLGAAALTFMKGVSGADAVAALSPGARRRVEQAGQGAVADATLAGMEPDALERIGCPVRIATGAASAPFYTEIAEVLAARIPVADHVRLPGLEHMAPVLRPDAVADAIEDFLT